jgi:glycosyltransferase involved in cell wall biosynthesis
LNRGKLLVVSHSFGMTGAPISLFNLLLNLRDRFTMLVVGREDGPLRQRFIDQQIEAVVEPEVMADTRLATRLLKNFDGLACNTLPAFIPIYAAAAAGKPSLWVVHEGLAWQHFLSAYAPLAPRTLNIATVLAVPCDFARRLYVPWREKPIEVVYWGVPEYQCNATPPEGAVRALLLGTYHPNKGQDIALAALQSLQNESIQFQMVGKIGDDAYYQKLQADYPPRSGVAYGREAPMEQTGEVIGQNDVVIVPSRDELTPLVILEAMAHGKVVVASDIGGIPEMITEGRTGFLFPMGDVSELARVIRRVARDGDLRRRVGAAAQQFVRENRTIAHCTDRYAGIISGMLRQAAPA